MQGFGLKESDAEAVDVGLEVEDLLFERLGGGPAGVIDVDGLVGEAPGEAEIRDDARELPVGCGLEEDVGALEVTVHNPEPVEARSRGRFRGEAEDARPRDDGVGDVEEGEEVAVYTKVRTR